MGDRILYRVIKMKKNAQLVGMIFSMMIFLIVFFIFLSPLINTVASNGITNGGFSGVEAFLLANFSLWVLIALGLGLLYYAWLGR